MLYRLIILRQRLIMYKSIRLVMIHLYKCRSWVVNKTNSSYIKFKNWCWDPSLHGHKVTLEICGRFVTNSKTTTWGTGYRPDNHSRIFRGEHVVKILPFSLHLEDHWPDSVTLNTIFTLEQETSRSWNSVSLSRVARVLIMKGVHTES